MLVLLYVLGTVLGIAGSHPALLALLALVITGVYVVKRIL